MLRCTELKSLGILSITLEMSRVGPEARPDVRDGIELYGFFSFLNVLWNFSKNSLLTEGLGGSSFYSELYSSIYKLG